MTDLYGGDWSQVWPAARAPNPFTEPTPRTGGPPAVRAGTQTAAGVPVPSGRARWRLTLHRRSYTAEPVAGTELAELRDARSVRVEQAWCTPAQLSFIMSGDAPAAKAVEEFAHEVCAWRWDETEGIDRLVIRAVVTASSETVTEQADTINFTCWDHLRLLERRFLTRTVTFNQTDQDSIVAGLVAHATSQARPSGSNTLFGPAAYLPVTVALVNPDGTSRVTAAVPRDRSYTGNQNIGEAIANLAAVIGGFDYDLQPAAQTGNLNTPDRLRIFYPYQGVIRETPILLYGTTVSGFVRSVNVSDYANYWRVIGNNGSEDPAAPQRYGEAWGPAAHDPITFPQGLWMSVDSEPDVTETQTLVDHAGGNLERSDVIVPNYTITLRPDAFVWENYRIGDVVPLIIGTARLNVNTHVRILGRTFVVGDDGQEDVELTVGRPDVGWRNLWDRRDRTVDALTRR